MANDAAAIRVLSPGLADQPDERFGVAFLDDRCGLLSCSFFGGGFCSQVEVPMREVFRRALEIDARALVIAHNHPVAPAVPSQADIAVTRRMAALARSLGISLLDHLIFAEKGAIASFRGLKLL